MERVIIKMIVKVKMRKVTSKKRTFADYSTYVLKLKSFSGVKIRTIEHQPCRSSVVCEERAL